MLKAHSFEVGFSVQGFRAFGTDCIVVSPREEVVASYLRASAFHVQQLQRKRSAPSQERQEDTTYQRSRSKGQQPKNAIAEPKESNKTKKDKSKRTNRTTNKNVRRRLRARAFLALQSAANSLLKAGAGFESGLRWV